MVGIYRNFGGSLRWTVAGVGAIADQSVFGQSKQSYVIERRQQIKRTVT
jgi:hypothetical protein